jgi:hypothetical protein
VPGSGTSDGQLAVSKCSFTPAAENLQHVPALLQLLRMLCACARGSVAKLVQFHAMAPSCLRSDHIVVAFSHKAAALTRCLCAFLLLLPQSASPAHMLMRMATVALAHLAGYQQQQQPRSAPAVPHLWWQLSTRHRASALVE